MNYPDGNIVRAGDLIWWNEGSCVGYVQSVADSREEFEAWGLDRPHLFLSNIHPFDSTQQSGIAYDEDCLADEGIGFLSAMELTDLKNAITKAQIYDRTFSVFADCQDGRKTHWRFEINNVDASTHVARVPFGTLTTPHPQKPSAPDNPER